jgi:hypothetical protein
MRRVGNEGAGIGCSARKVAMVRRLEWRAGFAKSALGFGEEERSGAPVALVGTRGRFEEPAELKGRGVGMVCSGRKGVVL